MNGLVIKITDFLRSIGLEVRFTPILAKTFLPGLKIDNRTLLIDIDRLTYPGDILHEAEHSACTPPDIRKMMDNFSTGNFRSTSVAIVWHDGYLPRHVVVDLQNAAGLNTQAWSHGTPLLFPLCFTGMG